VKRIQGTAEGLATLLEQLGPKLQEAAVAAQRENAQTVGDRLNSSRTKEARETVQFTDPGSWFVSEAPDGAVVGNVHEEARWAEEGRAPGPLPHAPIRAWVERNRHTWEARYRELVDKKGGQQGRTQKGRFVGHGDERERAQDEAAFAIQATFERDGIAPRWTLRRTLEGLKGGMARTIRNAVAKVLP
jgi:hypothetical protein